MFRSGQRGGHFDKLSDRLTGCFDRLSDRLTGHFDKLSDRGHGLSDRQLSDWGSRGACRCRDARAWWDVPHPDRERGQTPPLRAAAGEA